MSSSHPAVFHLDGAWLFTTFKSLYASCCLLRRAVENLSLLNTGTNAVTAPLCALHVIPIAIDYLGECFGTARMAVLLYMYARAHHSCVMHNLALLYIREYTSQCFTMASSEYVLNVICFLLLPLSQAFATSSDLFHLFLQRDVWSSHVFPEGTWSGYVYHGVILQTGQGRVYERNGGLGPRYVCGPEYPMCL